LWLCYVIVTWKDVKVLLPVAARLLPLKRFAVDAFSVVLFASVLVSPSLAQSSGLVAAYSFDEGTGAAVLDQSGNNLTGTIVGATWTTAGRYGNALSFNGASYVDLGNPVALRLTGSMTLEAWIKATGTPSNDGLIVAKSSGTGWQLKTSPDTGPHTFGVKVSASSTSGTQRYSTTVRALNTWYHIAGVYDAAAGTLSTYVNGVLDNGTLRGTVPTSQVDQSVNANIGRRTGGLNFIGLIDEVRIYNRALSQAEIQVDMATPVGNTPPPPDTTPPTVSITAPANGASVAGTAAVAAAASDNVGVAGVQFLLDGANLGSEVVTPPFTLQWNTSTASIGPHTLNAVARDFSGNTATSSDVSVTVSNPSPAQVGQWSAVNTWPMVAVHAMLLPSGDVLGWTDYTINGGAQIWRRTTNTFTPKTESTVSLFCSGHVYMPDGRLLVTGGIVGLQDDLGPQNGTIFDPVSENWSQGALMTYGRYYPSAVALGDGRVLVQGGTTTCKNCIADIPEIYDPVSNSWTALPTARMAFRYYPHQYVLPDGRVLVAAEDDAAISSRVLDLHTQTWTTVDSRVFDGHSSAMYSPGKIIKAGTATQDNEGLPTAATTYVLDMTQSSPAWQATAPMAFPRAYLNLTVLPDGEVLATGGGTTTDKGNFATAVHEAELWSSATKTWSTMARMQTPRLYHSTALLLPDGTVLAAGGGRHNGRSQPDPTDEPNGEIFSPPYLFRGPRPAISSAPSVIQYNAAFAVATPDAARIGSVSLIALSAVTHAFNENQHFVPLTFETNSGSLNVHGPVDGNTAPPGPYMLFLVDTTGVPSVAAMVRLPVPGSSTNPAPTVATISPTSGTTAGGTAVTITGTGFLSGATVSFGGIAATGVTEASSTSISASAPAHAVGAVGVAVTNTDNQSGLLANAYTYSSPNPVPTVTTISPTSGPTAGGTAVTITGTGFLSGATVSFGGTAATGVTVTSSTSINASSPAHAAGAVNVSVTNSDGQSGSLPTGYTYTSSNPTPIVTAVSPTSGTTAGGTSVTITGTGFLSGATVGFGGTAATGVTVVSGTSITVSSPAHAAGAVNVVVTNNDGQSGTLTNGYTYTSSTGGGTISFVQVRSATPQTASASVAVAYTAAQAAGNLNIVAVGWNDTTSTVSSVTDSRGNAYTLAIGPTTGTGLRQSIYYAKNILAGTNTVTVKFNQAVAYADVRVLEYKGLDPSNPLDVTAGAAGSGTTPSSGTASSTSANELIFGAGMTTTHFTGAGTGFTSRIITSPDADIAEDKNVTSTGSYSAAAPVTSSKWVMQMVALRAAP
jgi:hypothetical protein